MSAKDLEQKRRRTSRAIPNEMVSCLPMRVSSGLDNLSRDLCIALAMTRQPLPITPSGLTEEHHPTEGFEVNFPADEDVGQG
jgi:hypothetical protein